MDLHLLQVSCFSELCQNPGKLFLSLVMRKGQWLLVLHYLQPWETKLFTAVRSCKEDHIMYSFNIILCQWPSCSIQDDNISTAQIRHITQITQLQAHFWIGKFHQSEYGYQYLLLCAMLWEFYSKLIHTFFWYLFSLNFKQQRKGTWKVEQFHLNSTNSSKQVQSKQISET